MIARADPHRRLTIGIAAALLSLGAALTGYAFYLAAGLDQPLAEAGALVLLGFCSAVAFSLVLAVTRQTTAAAWLLVLALMVLMPATAVLIAGVGLLLGLALTLLAAIVAGLILPADHMRPAISLSLVIGVATLFIDLLWPADRERLILPAEYREVVLPAAAGLLLTGFGALIVRRFGGYRLSTKLLLGFLTVALVPLTLLGLYYDRTTRDALTATAQQTLAAAALQSAGTLDTFNYTNLENIEAEARLDPVVELIELPHEQRAGSDQEQAVRATLFELERKGLRTVEAARGAKIIEAYALIDGQGRLIATTNRQAFSADSYVDAVFFRNALYSGEASASPLQFSATNQPRLYFSAPVRNARDELRGVLVAQVSAFWIQRIVDEADGRAGPESFAILFDDVGFRLADSQAAGTNAFRFADLPGGAQLAELAAAQRVPASDDLGRAGDLPELTRSLSSAPAFFSGPVHVTDRREPNHLAAAVRLKSQPWVVIFAQPELIALAPAAEQTRTTTLVLIGVGLLVAGAALLATRALTGPINRLAGLAEAVAHGDLSVRARQETHDEIGRLATTFNAMAAQIQRSVGELEQRVADRTGQFQAAADIARATAGVRDLDRLLRLALDLVRDHFGYYHASIFLMDEAGQYAVLRESTGEIGEQLKARGHRLGLGSRSLVGWVTQNRLPRVAKDVAGDPFHFKNPLLPETRSECSIPLIVGQRLVGVLNVQSRSLDAFDERAVQALQTLADQLAVAIENAELFQQAQRNLNEVRALYQQTTLANWRALLGSQQRDLIFELEPGAASQPGGPPIEILLRIRDQVIGVIELHGRPGPELSPEERAVLDTVSVQLSTAIESAILYQESLRRSWREQLISQISDQMRATLNPASIMQSGIRELGRALGATEVVVKLQPRGGPPRGQP